MFQDGRIDFNYPVGHLSLHEPPVLSQIMFVAKVEDDLLVAVPYGAG